MHKNVITFSLVLLLYMSFAQTSSALRAPEDTPQSALSASPPDAAKESGEVRSAVEVPCIDLQEPAVEKAAADGKCRWQKKELKVVFLDGSGKLHASVTKAAREWEAPSGLKFNFGTHADSDIRVSFAHAGHYSYIGNLAARIDKKKHTMNLQFTDQTSPNHVRMITLHEFGHALGLVHEHQSPASGIQWNEAEVMTYYQGPPNHWDSLTIRLNILDKYQGTQTMRTSAFDADSIMLYPIQKRFTTNEFSSKWNEELSPTDREFIRAFYKDLFATEQPRDTLNFDERIAAIVRPEI